MSMRKSFAVWRRREIRRSLCCAGGLGFRGRRLQRGWPSSVGRTVRGSFASSSACRERERGHRGGGAGAAGSAPGLGRSRLRSRLSALGRQAVPAASTITAICVVMVASSRRSHFGVPPCSGSSGSARRAVADGFQGRFPHGRRSSLPPVDDHRRSLALSLGLGPV